MDDPTLFGEEDATGKIRPLPVRCGIKRNTTVQRHLPGKIDPRKAEALILLRQALASADHEALLHVICCAAWWCDYEECLDLGAVLMRILGGEVVREDKPLEQLALSPAAAEKPPVCCAPQPVGNVEEF